MQKISAYILASNEAEKIADAVSSVLWADEIIVADSGSTDRTAEIAQALGARIVQIPFHGFGDLRNRAIAECRHEWIFSLDADERVSHELKQSIQRLREKPDDELGDGYQIARRTYYQKRWIRGGGWYPDRQLRLFRKHKGHWKQRHIHESVTMDPGARVEQLKGDLLHYTSQDAAHHHKMIGERYAPLAALQMFEEGRRTSVLGVASAGPAAFIRSLILKGGLRDGFAGFTIASFAAHHAFLKHLMLWEKQTANNTDKKAD